MNRFRGRGLKPDDMNEEVCFLIDGMIVEKGITLLYGPPGIGKSYLILGITKAVAEKGKTIQYIDYDNPISALKERGAEFIMDPAVYPNVDYIHPTVALDDEGMPMTSRAVLSDIASGARPHAYDNWLFVVDSLTDFVEDLKSEKHVKDFFIPVKKVRDAGGTFIILHHPNKDEKNFQGHELIRSAVDVLEELRKGTDDVFLIGIKKSRFSITDHAVSVDKDFNMQLVDYSEARISDDDRKFIDEVQKVLKAGEHPQSKLLEKMKRRKEDRAARALLEKYAGRFWNRDSGPNNSLLYTLIEK